MVQSHYLYIKTDTHSEIRRNTCKLTDYEVRDPVQNLFLSYTTFLICMLIHVLRLNGFNLYNEDMSEGYDNLKR